MKVLRLSKVIGVLEVIAALKESQEDAVFILNENILIFKFLDSLSSNGVNLSKIKIVNEINFKFDALLKDKYTGEIIIEARTFSEILEKINYGQADRYLLILLTDERNRPYISKIIQQFIYIDLHIDVILEKEEKDRNAVRAFKEYFNEIKASLYTARQRIYDAAAKDLHQLGKYKFIKIIDDIESMVLEAEDRELTVAVMATKKSGKSVLVNSFLGNDYAPTSFELATPNSIIYKSNNEKKLVLSYRNGYKEFQNVDLLRHYVESIYKSAEYDIKRGQPVEDMYIHYINENKHHNNFTLIDTPGPNLAGSNHKEIAYKWIEVADVIIFVIDYSKYLTDDEEKYLRDIKTIFDKYDKTHSFIVIVNKIDLLYASGEKNSVVRFLDYLRFKLEGLGYSGFVIFAASALQYFTALKVPKLKGCEQLVSAPPHELIRELRKCKSTYMGRKELSLIRILEDYLRDLEDYQGIVDADLNTLLEKSGVTRLMDYTNYIATQKASLEVYKAIMRKIDDRFVNMKNNFFSFQLTYLNERMMIKQKEKEELIRIIEKLYDVVKLSNTDISKALDFTDLLVSIESLCSTSDSELSKMLESSIKKEIDAVKHSLLCSTEEELKEIVDGNVDYISSKVQTNFQKILLDIFNEKAGQCQRKVNSELDRLQKYLSLIDKELQTNIGVFNDYLNTSLQVNGLKITLPRLELAFSRKNLDFSKIDEKVNDQIYDMLKKCLYQRHGVIGHLMKLATLNQVDKRFGKFELDVDNICEMLNSLSQDIKVDVISTIKENNITLLNHVTTILKEKLHPKIDEEIRAVFNNYMDLIKQVEDAFMASKADIENDINFIREKLNFLEVSRDSLQMFFNVWERIRKEVKDSKLDLCSPCPQ
ncbi:dynamin family protein [Clostridium thermarum]|uniref:dynamin family protein n=1 Tax=Clostridium thermarum TaxID=1716543 RepID=UPI0013D40620|nr:dynamin family protein [Clostridium thermarum]